MVRDPGLAGLGVGSERLGVVWPPSYGGVIHSAVLAEFAKATLARVGCWRSAYTIHRSPPVDRLYHFYINIASL